MSRFRDQRRAKLSRGTASNATAEGESPGPIIGDLWEGDSFWSANSCQSGDDQAGAASPVHTVHKREGE